MSHTGQAPGPAGGSAAGPSLADGKAQLARSRFLGRVSAFIFLLAVLAVLDGLQTLIRHEFNSIDLLPGESLLLSGMMPADAKSHDDLVVTVSGEPGLSFEPMETYKGFWMGGHMWRARLTAAPDMGPGRAEIVVEDIIKPPAKGSGTLDERDRGILFGGQQNPALVFSVTVWPGAEARQAADHSLFRRYTGFPAFGVAAFSVLAAVLLGAANWLAFSRAEKTLAAHGVFFIHGIKDLAVAAKQALPGQKILATSGYRAAFARAGQPFALGDPVILLDRDWKEQARGVIMDIDRIKAHARFPEDGVRPRYGWLVQRGETE